MTEFSSSFSFRSNSNPFNQDLLKGPEGFAIYKHATNIYGKILPRDDRLGGAMYVHVRVRVRVRASGCVLGNDSRGGREYGG